MSEFNIKLLPNNSAILFDYLGEEINVVIPDTYQDNNITTINKRAFISNSSNIETLVLPKFLINYEFIISSNLKKLKKITFLNEDTKVNSYSFEGLCNLEEINLFAWKFLPKIQLYNVVSKKIKDWDIISIEEQKQILSFIKRSSTKKKFLFLSEKPEIISFLLNQKINISLDLLNEFIDYYIKIENTTITAMLIEYKNNNYTKEEIKNNLEFNELVEIGLELPTLKQFKSKWICSSYKGGLRVSGYKGTNTVETIPEMLACGTKIIALNSTKTSNFNPIKKLTIEAPITCIPENYFSGSSTLEEIILTDTINSIENDAFYNCINLKTFIIPPKVTIIEPATFYGCQNLATVEFHENLKIISKLAFFRCFNLSNISIPESVVEIQSQVFDNCLKLVDENGFIIYNNFLCSYVNDDEVVKIPDNVKIICKSAFFFKSLKEVIIPDSVEIVQHQAFCFCRQIENVMLSPKTILEGTAFFNCKFQQERYLNS